MIPTFEALQFTEPLFVQFTVVFRKAPVTDEQYRPHETYPV
jgi:hypothetical protein